MKKLILMACCVGSLSGCAAPGHRGYTVYLPFEMTKEAGAVAHLDECGYSEETKEFMCTRVAIHPDTSEDAETQIELKTDWVGAVAVGNDDKYFGNVGWLPTRELGLRSDGVLVWREKGK